MFVLLLLLLLFYVFIIFSLFFKKSWSAKVRVVITPSEMTRAALNLAERWRVVGREIAPPYHRQTRRK